MSALTVRSWKLAGNEREQARSHSDCATLSRRGGDKATQHRDIARAREYLNDYHGREKRGSSK